MSLEHYLQRATRGTWGQRRQTLKCELRGSIEARAWTHELHGLNATQALELAMQEMGDTRAMAAGFTRTHTMPTILKNSFVAGILVSALAATLPVSQAQIEVISSFQLFNNTRIFPEPENTSYYLNMASIKANLEALGIAVDDTSQESQWKNDAIQGITLPTLRFTLPDAAKETLLQSVPGQDSPWKNPEGVIAFNPNPKGNQAIGLDEAYISFFSFMHQLKESGLPISLEGWTNPRIKVGEISLQIGGQKQSANPLEIYTMVILQHWNTVAKNITGFNLTYFGAAKHAVRVNAPAGTVYGIITNKDSSQPVLDIARVADDGVLYFKAPKQYLRFVSTPEELNRNPMQKSAHDYGSQTKPAKALLLRISSDLSSKFEVPARTRSVALK